jgi:hypothetical protein
MPRPSHYSRFYPSDNIGGEYKLRSSSLWNILHSPVTSALFGPDILITWLFNSLSLCLCLIERDQVSHPYTITGNIILTLPFLDMRPEDNSVLNGSKRPPNLISSYTFLTFIQVEPFPSIIVRHCCKMALVRVPEAEKYNVQLCFAHDSSFLQEFSFTSSAFI